MKYSFIAVGDPHLATRNPGSRKDDYFASCKEKLTFILKQAILLKVNSIIFTGDTFHDKDQSKIDSQLLHMLLNFFSIAKKYGIMCYSVVGNHDMKFHDADISQRNIALLTRAADNFILVDKSPQIVEISGKKIAITGSSFIFHGDRGDISERTQYFPPKQDAFYHIHVTHGSQMPRQEVSNANFMEITESENILYANPAWDLNVNGHIHWVEQKIVRYKNKYILNPCSLTRGSLSMDNIKRGISVTLVEISLSNKETTFTEIEVPAKKAEEVFDVNTYLEEKQLDAKVQLFIDMLRESSLSSDSSNNQLELLVYNSDADSEVKDKAIEYIQKLDN